MAQYGARLVSTKRQPIAQLCIAIERGGTCQSTEGVPLYRCNCSDKLAPDRRHDYYINWLTQL